MCIIAGPVAPSNTILIVKGLREGLTAEDSRVAQVQLMYVNNLQSTKAEAKISGGVMIVPICFTKDVKVEEEEKQPFFVDVKGDNVQNIAHAVKKAVVIRSRIRQKSSRSSFSSGGDDVYRSFLEVVELKEGGYNVSFAPTLAELEKKIDTKTLNIDPIEWQAIAENTKLRFGDSKDAYGFVVAVPRVDAGSIKRGGFSLVYWTRRIEFPTVHEQTTKTKTPIMIEMDATLVGLNVAIVGLSEAKQGTYGAHLIDDNEYEWKRLAQELEDKKCSLPSHGILASKPKRVWPAQVEFISYLPFTGSYPNVNIRGVFIGKDTLGALQESVNHVLKLEKAAEVLKFQSTLNKHLGVSSARIQEQDLMDSDSDEYRRYMALQMVFSAHVAHVAHVAKL